jgi:hypothetical protein
MIRTRTMLVLAVGLVALAFACARAGPPRIALHTPCTTCGMEVTDLRFACERTVGGHWRVYDAIECMMRDVARAPGGAAALADYDSRALISAGEAWVVRGDFPSPMGGGFAAFARRGGADSVAAATHGAVDRFDAWIAREAR